jgi:hypothetical protein
MKPICLARLACILAPIAILSLAAFVATSTSEAATIAWSPATAITGDGNVSTYGTLVGAINIGGPGVADTTVNGVLFVGLAMTGFNLTSDNFNLTAPNGMSYAGGSGLHQLPPMPVSLSPINPSLAPSAAQSTASSLLLFRASSSATPTYFSGG